MCFRCFKVFLICYLNSEIHDWCIAQRANPMRVTKWFHWLVVRWNCPGNGCVLATNQHKSSPIWSHITENLQQI